MRAPTSMSPPTSMSRLLLCSLSVASALQWAPRVVQSAARRPVLRPVLMAEGKLPKSGTMGPENPPPMFDEDGNEIMDEWESQEDEEEKLVPMSTPLGNNVDLSPLPGPDVPVDGESNAETRPPFALFSLYQPQQAPSEALQLEYTDWLAGGAAAGTIVCHAFYLVSPSASGDALADADDLNSMTMTSDETDARDRARLEALQALAAEFPPDAPDAEPDLDVYVDALGEPLFEPIETGMVFQESPYVLGNINVIRADTRAAAEAFAALDPCAGVGGYAETAVYEWGLQKGEELNVPRGNGPTFLILGRDAPSASPVRSSCRDAHLSFLASSGRVHLAGPLLDATGSPAGSLLCVKGEEHPEVAAWAGHDPYQQAGVFGLVMVAMAPEFAVEETTPLFTWG